MYDYEFDGAYRKAYIKVIYKLIKLLRYSLTKITFSQVILN